MPVLKRDSKHYGVMGTPTKFKAKYSRDSNIYIGDIIKYIYKPLKLTYCSFVTESEGKQFIMGIREVCNDTTGELTDGWEILSLEKSFASLPIGYELEDIEVYPDDNDLIYKYNRMTFALRR